MTTGVAIRQDEAAGIEDVFRSVRALARQTRGLAESAASVAERELAMAISIAEQLRDKVIAQETLERARREELPARLRQDAHRTLDLVADAASVAYVTVLGFAESFIDDPRPPIGGTGKTVLTGA